MSKWLVAQSLPWILPLVIQAFMPTVIEYLKIACGRVKNRLPEPVLLALVAVMAESANQLQSYITEHPLPYGLGPFIAVLVNTTLAHFGRQPPTPGAGAPSGLLGMMVLLGIFSVGCGDDSSVTNLTCVNSGPGTQTCIDGSGNIINSPCTTVNGALVTSTGESCDASSTTLAPTPEPTPEP